MSHRPNPPPADPRLDFLAGGGETGALMRATDWAATPLGPPAGWPQALASAVSICLNAQFPICIYWGNDLTLLYNDAWSPIPGAKHPGALGRPAREVWNDIWELIDPVFRQVRETGRGTFQSDALLPMRRHGYTEECYFDYTFSPVRGADGVVAGVFNAVTETTYRVIGARRTKVLRDLAGAAARAKTAEDACRLVAEALSAAGHDVAFALLYFVATDTRSAALAATAGLPRGGPHSPEAVLLEGAAAGWPLAEAVRSGGAVVVDGLDGTLPGGAWPESPSQAIVLPVAATGRGGVAAVLVAGVSPRRALDDEYRSFFQLVSDQVATALANARAYEEERRRAEHLAELDRAKTAFFSNVSHEFRTPLTLMLGPLEDILGPGGEVLPRNRDLLTTVHRNGQRLLKLVNALLDFSRIEAGRVRANYEPTDLAAYTAELASVFRSAVEKAGLALVIDCPPLPEPVHVDRDMWEKVVLNLVSNAFKFTLAGEIRVRLRPEHGRAVLTVEDTGTGVPEEELPKLFNRFHRVEGARGRTHEGSGIGLALVQELARLHGGDVAVRSTFGQGSAFTVGVPLGAAHLPAERIGRPGAHASASLGASPFVAEALRWLPDADPPSGAVAASLADDPHAVGPSPGGRPRVVLADDNADMRDYVRRLLSGHYDVVPARDGTEALTAATAQAADLVLTDVMMPGLDGFGLLEALRADPRTAGTPVIMLSARAGEEARVEGLEAGADDYLVKPFAARELLAKVGGTLALARTRREAARRERALKDELSRVLESMTDGFVAIDPGWRFTYVNAAAERITGMSRDDLVGKTQWETFPATVGTPNEEAYRRAMDARVPAFAENYYPPFDRWFEINAYPVDGGGIAVYFRDITDRKRAEQALRASEERLRVLDAIGQATRSHEDAGAVMATTAGLLGRYLKVTRCAYADVEADNDRFTIRSDWTDGAASTAGTYSLDLFGPRAAADMRGGRTLVIRDIDAELLPGSGADMFNAIGIKAIVCCPLVKGGRLVAMMAVHHAAPRGWTAGEVSLVEEVVDRSWAHIERVRAAAELREQDRRKDEFLATLAHELRNPLAPVRNGLSILRLSAPAGAGAPADRALGMMERQLGHMVRLIDDLLDVSRVSRGKVELRKERVTLRAVVDTAVETSRPLVEAGRHTLVVRLPDDPLVLVADPTRLAQVVSNLLNNSAKYTPDGGRIELTAARDGGEVAVRVSDTGVGIPREMLPRVFDLFTQVGRSIDRAQGGLGIGLSLVKKLMEMHGGTVEADSPGPGAGSTFTLRLPLTGPEDVATAAAPGAAVDSGGGRRVLVVDDNADAAESMATVLELLGHAVRVAHGGPAALAAARNYRPEVVFLDIGMPGMNGYEVARRLTADPELGPVVLVALTGWGTEDDKRLSADAGFDFHLTKPVDTQAVVAVLSQRPAVRQE